MKEIIKKKYPRDGWIMPFFTKKAANEVLGIDIIKAEPYITKVWEKPKK